MQKLSKVGNIQVALGVFLFALVLTLIWTLPSSATAAPSSGVTDISIVNDRWPDTSTPKNFGESAVRIMNASTNEEKALAVFRFIQQTTMVIANVPSEPAYNNQNMVNPEKLLNVYGAHWCDGLSRIMQMVWRGMGYRAQKHYKFGHTLADIHYEDEDGIERWHVFDNSAYHWFLWDRTGTHIATPEELILDRSLSTHPSRTLVPAQVSPPVPSYIHESHLKFLDYTNHFDLRNGEKVTFYWSNINKPYYVPTGHDVGGYDFEHGPYEKTYGNAVWEYSPDFSQADYRDGLYTEPDHVSSIEEDGLKPNLHPDKVNTTGSLIYRFSYPYILSDAWVDASFLRNTAEDRIELSISNDGSNWKTLWVADAIGQIQLTEFNISESFDVAAKYPQDLITPFGHYEYYLKIEMSADRYVTDCGIESLRVTNVTQHNIFSLPQLWPVHNQVTVSGDISPASSLKVTYAWEDVQGTRQNIVIVEDAPFTYEILADGKQWEDVVSKQLIVEAIPRIGSGNSVLQKEESPANTEDISPDDAFLTTDIVDKWTVPEVQSTAAYIEDIQEGLIVDDFTKIHKALSGLMVLRDPAAKQALLDVIYHDTSYKYYTKYWATQALYLSSGEEALPVMIDILERDPSIGWTDVTGEFDQDSVWLWTCPIASYILSEINSPGARDAVMLITDLLDTPRLQERLGGRDPFSIYRWVEIRWGLIRAVGILGGTTEIPILVAEIDKEWTGESSYNAVQALGNIGDSSVVPVILDFMDRTIRQSSNRMKLLYSIEALGKLGDESIAPKLYPYLEDWDENFRGYTATALGNLGSKDAIPYLEALLEKETFPWVIQAAQKSLAMLKGSPTNSFQDVPPSHWAFEYIEVLYQQDYVAGCSQEPLLYCPDQAMTRAESAVFIERGHWGAGYIPSQPTAQIFSDVSLGEWYAKWATSLWNDGYTAGCGLDPLIYCPLQSHTMAEGAVFYMRMLYGPDYEPSDPTGIFADASPSDWFTPWIEAAYLAGIYPPCQTEPELMACPHEPLTRAMGAYMMVMAKDISTD